MDYGFHAPTMSWPLVGGIMIEPTESEDKGEIDRYIDALIRIRQEIKDVEDGKVDKVNNVIKNAPHTLKRLMSDNWNYHYSRETAAYPAPWIHARGKVFPTVARIDSAFGDRNPVCACPPMGDYAGEYDEKKLKKSK